MMKTEQCLWTPDRGWQHSTSQTLGSSADLVFLFGSRDVLIEPARFDEVRKLYPNANIISGSTAGEILGIEVFDNTCAVTAVEFEHTPLAVANIKVTDSISSREIGRSLTQSLPTSGLVHIFVLSDGQKVNGSELVKGLHEELPESVTVTGGLAGDAARFEKTLVGINQAPTEGNVVAVGFYGQHIRVGHGSMGGWDSFGARRRITRSNDNVLYELDGQSALDLYKKYLGDQAEGLPGTALLFPLSIQIEGSDEVLVRTVLSIDEAAKSMTFAGDMPEGCYVRMMKANMDRLVDAASNAATNSFQTLNDTPPELAILVSCVGRKLVLDQRVEEEVENVYDVLGEQTAYTGFYSYGEISPLSETACCELHNQTMTITTFSEQ